VSLHDEYARFTPYELAFSESRQVVEGLLERIAEEAAARGGDPENLHQFVTMGAVGSFVRELEGPETPSGAILEYGTLIYHGVHFAEAGYPLYLLTAPAARYLVQEATSGIPRPPASGGYLQLPQHLFWAELADDAPPESVDGFFWRVTPTGLLHTLAATGMRPDRPGLAVMALPEAPLADAERWVGASAREGGEDFRSALPGSELDRLYSFRTAGEILKLLARFFAYVEGAPDSVEVRGPAAEGSTPRASGLDYRRVTL
jgi:hypothetical protein